MMTPKKTSMTKHVSTRADAVYRRPEFSDLLTSNNFYTVSAIALVLGISSAFGFIQNPRKLKAVVDTLSYKVSIAHPNNQRMSYQVFQEERYDLSASIENYGSSVGSIRQKSRFSENNKYLFEPRNLVRSSGKHIQRVAFSYDITSDKFWNDFSSSSIGRLQDEKHKYNYNHYSLNNIQDDRAYLEKGDSKYSIANDLIKN